MSEKPAPAEPFLVAGPPAAVTERLLAFTAIGFTSFSVSPNGPGLRDQAEQFAREVIPAVRAAR